MLNINIQNILDIRKSAFLNKQDLDNACKQVENYFNDESKYLNDTLEVLVTISKSNLQTFANIVEASGLSINIPSNISTIKSTHVDVTVFLSLDTKLNSDTTPLDKAIENPSFIPTDDPIFNQTVSNPVLEEKQINTTKKVTSNTNSNNPFIIPNDSLVFNGSPF